MLEQMLYEDSINFTNVSHHWEEALQSSSDPLLKRRIISQDYVNAIIRNVKELGPYIVLTDGVAFAHARPEDGALASGITLLNLKEGTTFPNKEKPVYLIFTFAAVSDDSHLTMLTELSHLLSNPENINRLKNTETYEEVMEIVHENIIEEDYQ
ncbi:PTS sugar transporter subunit IIA [Marinococcus halotolerans]|uniref:PTS sugar transporter subunit IIA n=1 Tax=Marinococcus halotolerans TaxID=301092 RepID=UPI0003B50862|nr:PTS sugar transporter subunit IIA [Marinococcus halotolerans]